MSNHKFLLDTNSFITPHLSYYPFDFAPGFWNQMEEKILSGHIVILDLVKDELLQGKDSLSKWIDDLTIGDYIDHRDPLILAKYSEILQSIQNNPCYKDSALTEWARNNIADAWLIATAAVKGYTIVTFEEHNSNLNIKYPSKNAKIPDIASEFGVQTVKLFHMMRELSFELK